MGLLKRRIIESEEPKEEPPMVNTVDTDIVESLRYVAQSSKPVDAGQMRAAADEIERLRAERRWIPASERLPEDGDDVLVSWGTPESELLIAHWRADEHEWFDDQGKRVPAARVTHWMRLPEPPPE